MKKGLTSRVMQPDVKPFVLICVFHFLINIVFFYDFCKAMGEHGC